MASSRTRSPGRPRFPSRVGKTCQEGNRLVAWPSASIHSNGLTLAWTAVTREHEYTDPFPPEPDRSIGEVHEGDAVEVRGLSLS